MYPIINIFGREIASYGIMTASGVLAGGFFVCRTAKKRNHDDNDYIIFMLICAIGVLVGSHLLYAITQWKIIGIFLSNLDRFAATFGDLIANLIYIFGGSVFYGGLLGGIAAGVIYGKIKKLDLKEYSDICTPMIPLFHAFGRVGCFLGGCCFGIESPLGFTVHGNELVPMINDVQRFPVQLLEASLNLILFFVLWYLLKKDIFKGRLIFVYLLSYSVIRFFDEFLRGDTYRGFLFVLSTSQIISILIFAVVVIDILTTFIKSKKRQTKNTVQL